MFDLSKVLHLKSRLSNWDSNSKSRR